MILRQWMSSSRVGFEANESSGLRPVARTPTCADAGSVHTSAGDARESLWMGW